MNNINTCELYGTESEILENGGTISINNTMASIPEVQSVDILDHVIYIMFEVQISVIRIVLSFVYFFSSLMKMEILLDLKDRTSSLPQMANIYR